MDVFLADLQRLADLAGVKSDALLSRAFIAGLPPGVSAQLRSAVRLKNFNQLELLEHARILMANQVESAAFLSQAKSAGGKRSAGPSAGRDRACFGCGELGHFIRSCPRNSVKKHATAKTAGNATGRP